MKEGTAVSVRKSFSTEEISKSWILLRVYQEAVRFIYDKLTAPLAWRTLGRVINPTEFLRKLKIHAPSSLKKCAEGTFRVHKIYGDGNCMFRAISYILWQNEDGHRHLRTMVVQHIKESWHEYGPFVIAEWNISDRQEYCDYMSMVGTYASELECTVATKICHLNLSIYRKINGSYELKRVFHNRINPEYEIARLLFTGNPDSGHYDVLFPG